MKVKILMAVNIEGREYGVNAIADLKPVDARALCKGGYAVAVKERAVPNIGVETRVID